MHPKPSTTQNTTQVLIYEGVVTGVPFPKPENLFPQRYSLNPDTPMHDLSLTFLHQVLIYEGVVTGVLNFDYSSQSTVVGNVRIWMNISQVLPEFSTVT